MKWTPCFHENFFFTLNSIFAKHVTLQASFEFVFLDFSSYRSIVAPMLTRPHKAWSNFWGALDKEGYYRRSFDYMDIINNKQQWECLFYKLNLPCQSITTFRSPPGDYGTSRTWPVATWSTLPYYDIQSYDRRTPAGMTITIWLFAPAWETRLHRSNPHFLGVSRFLNVDFTQGVYMFVDNRYTYGHLVDLEGFNTSRTNPNMYELFANRLDWERAYLHHEYYDNFQESRTPLQVFVISNSHRKLNCKYWVDICLALPGRVLVSHRLDSILQRVHRNNGKFWTLVGRFQSGW